MIEAIGFRAMVKEARSPEIGELMSSGVKLVMFRVGDVNKISYKVNPWKLSYEFNNIVRERIYLFMKIAYIASCTMILQISREN